MQKSKCYFAKYKNFYLWAKKGTFLYVNSLYAEMRLFSLSWVFMILRLGTPNMLL